MDSTVSKRQRDVRRDQPRHDQIIHRMRRQRPQRVNLFRHAHRADFGRDGRADAPGHHQRRQHRAEFARTSRRPRVPGNKSWNRWSRFCTR
jgi:hypothetical protein